MTDTTTSSDSNAVNEEHTLIHSTCDQCDEVDGLTILKHEKDSKQVQAINNAHQTMAKNHTENTGHNVEIGVIADTPQQIVNTAMIMADSLKGVNQEDITEEETYFK